MASEASKSAITVLLIQAAVLVGLWFLQQAFL
jgi:hypothetical protein